MGREDDRPLAFVVGEKETKFENGREVWYYERNPALRIFLLHIDRDPQKYTQHYTADILHLWE